MSYDDKPYSHWRYLPSASVVDADIADLERKQRQLVKERAKARERRNMALYAGGWFATFMAMMGSIAWATLLPDASAPQILVICLVMSPLILLTMLGFIVGIILLVHVSDS